MHEQELDYLSEDVQEILSTPPSWIATWGTTVILITLILMGIVGWNFTHPETVRGDVILTTSEPPVPVYANMPGKLSMILVKENQEVEVGQTLAVIDNSANYLHVMELEEEISKLGEFDLLAFQNFSPNESLELGSIRPNYIKFINTLEEFSFSKSSRIDLRSVKTLEKQIEEKELLIDGLLENEKIAKRELADLELEYKAAQVKYGETQATEDFQKQIDLNSEKTSKEAELNGFGLKIIEKNEEIAELRTAILGKNLDAQGKNRERISDLRQNLNELKTKIGAWKKDFLITATMRGNVSFYNSKTDQQFFKKGEEVMAIVPIQTDKQYVGYITLSATDSRAVNPNQTVKIKFPDKNGLVEGKVNSISRLPKDDAREVKVDFEDVLITNQNEEVNFTQMMSGKAEIVIGEKRFITRIFNELMGNS